MSLLNFAPANHFYDKIQQGLKIGTIRDKPKRVGETLHLWEGKRGMRKGYYCRKCWNFCIDKAYRIHEKCGRCGDNGLLLKLPRKIAEKKCTSCAPIQIMLEGDILRVCTNPDGPYEGWKIDANNPEIVDFARGEGFNSNREMVEFFRKHLDEGVWTRKYWIRWV